METHIKFLVNVKLKNHNIITKIYLKKYRDINSTIDKFLKDLKIKKTLRNINT